jgi:hypothetical protein
MIYGFTCSRDPCSASSARCIWRVWADHSWGRFWGWDPIKMENGAVLDCPC